MCRSQREHATWYSDPEIVCIGFLEAKIPSSILQVGSKDARRTLNQFALDASKSGPERNSIGIQLTYSKAFEGRLSY